MVVVGVLSLVLGCALLAWCAIGLGRANPGTRLPGPLPAVRHPEGYMPFGMLGMSLVIGGAMLATSSAALGAWIVAAAIIAGALGGPFVVHNRRLPR